MAKKLPGLTVLELRALKPREDGKEFEVRDEAITGGYVCVRKSGRLSYVLRFRVGGVSKKLTVGAFNPDDGGLKKVRDEARLAQVTLSAARRGVGADPASLKQAQRRAAEEAVEQARIAELATRKNTFGSVCKEYFDDADVRALRPVTLRERRRQVDKELVSWRDKPITEITKQDVRDLLRRIAADRPIMANRTHATASHIFRWAVENDHIATNPMQGLRRPLKEETPRDRTLSDDELVAVWRAAGTLDTPWSQFFKLSILTGARKSELALATWSEFDLDAGIWKLPAARSKNKQAIERPLAPMTVELLRSLPRIAGVSFIFGNACTAVQRAKSRLDDATGPLSAPWVVHDLRRVFATNMQRLHVPQEVTERLLAHKTDSQTGVSGIYSRYTFASEMAEAANKWANRVAQITREPEPTATTGNVVSFGGRRT